MFPNLKHFTEYELQKVSRGTPHFDETALRNLDQARDLAGIPFYITSAYRSKEHELSKGRSGNSAHTRGMAFDIACCSSRERFIIVDSLMRVGCNRIGIAGTFIHADFDSSLDQQVIWLY